MRVYRHSRCPRAAICISESNRTSCVPKNLLNNRTGYFLHTLGIQVVTGTSDEAQTEALLET